MLKPRRCDGSALGLITGAQKAQSKQHKSKPLKLIGKKTFLPFSKNLLFLFPERIPL
jgi:hypothetical protein